MFALFVNYVVFTALVFVDGLLFVFGWVCLLAPVEFVATFRLLLLLLDVVILCCFGCFVVFLYLLTRCCALVWYLVVFRFALIWILLFLCGFYWFCVYSCWWFIAFCLLWFVLITLLSLFCGVFAFWLRLWLFGFWFVVWFVVLFCLVACLFDCGLFYGCVLSVYVLLCVLGV